MHLLAVSGREARRRRTRRSSAPRAPRASRRTRRELAALRGSRARQGPIRQPGCITCVSAARRRRRRVATAAQGQVTPPACAWAGVTHRARPRARTAPAPIDRRLRPVAPARRARPACPWRQTALHLAAGTAPRFAHGRGGTACARKTRSAAAAPRAGAGCARFAVQREQRIQPHVLQVRVSRQVQRLRPLCDARRSGAGRQRRRQADAPRRQRDARPQQLPRAPSSCATLKLSGQVTTSEVRCDVATKTRRLGAEDAAMAPQPAGAAAQRGRSAQRRRERSQAPEGGRGTGRKGTMCGDQPPALDATSCESLLAATGGAGAGPTMAARSYGCNGEVKTVVLPPQRCCTHYSRAAVG